MGYDIYIKSKSDTNYLRIPIVPAELPSITKNIANDEFTTYNEGTYNFIQEVGLDTLTLEGWLPMKKYYFSKSDIKAVQVIDLINTALKNRECIYLKIITSNGSPYIDKSFSVESFEYHMLRRGDYAYSLGLKEYKEYKTTNYKEGWNQNATGWWYCTSVENYTWYSSCWQLIDGQWYYFNKDGYALSNSWLLWENNWYYLKENCQMAKTGWMKIDGKWYYFSSTGALYVNCKTPDGYIVDSNGAWIEG